MKHILIIFVLLAAPWLPSTPAVHAEPSLEQALKLFQDGQTAESLQAVQVHLQVWSGEPRGLFLRGLALERLGRTAEAMDAYRDLINIHPEFPEPYNNLARLLASQGKLEEAKEILHQALRTHPSYAAAHQNLTRIYSAMAGQVYRRVLGIEEGSLQVSLDSLEELTVVDGQTLLVDATMPTVSALSMVAAASAKPPLEPEVPSGPDSALVAVPVDPPVAPEDAPLIPDSPLVPADEEAVVTTPEPQEQSPPSVQPESQQPAASPELELRQSMKSVLHEWAKAWAEQDVEAYLSFYSVSFVPEDNLEYAQWKEQRRTRVAAPPFIRISLSEIVVSEQEQGIIQVRFLQHYRSNIINSRVRKELLFAQENGQWRIIRERLLSQ